jgi:outer membrane protein assembly factor BamD (BamD/ComL family)
MRLNRYIISAFLWFVLLQIFSPSYSQLGISFDIKKPRQYEDRVLKSEKSDQKKFNLPRRFIQNTVTHYNYFFNANNKLNEIIDRAKAAYKDDYSELLPFYNYSLDFTAQDKIQLDSVINKSTTGIVLHDLRNDWIDNLYLLWGAAYYLRKDFDSAFLTFQFINYAFAEKESDGYYKYIGSRLDGNSAMSIATKEKNTLPKRIFTEPPSRNDAFIWQTRTFIAQDEFPEAASLIITLKNDPVFPNRLRNDLEEVQAWWFYKQEMWDSSASHLVNALDNATNKQERARWEYLAAQLYEKSGEFEEAQKYYARAIGHTTDPVMDIYARLNSIRINKKGGEDLIDKNIAALLRMARRDKFQDYRDVIYYMAAQMELERNNLDAAQKLLLKGVEYNNGNYAQKNKAFLQLADMAYAQKRYPMAHSFYDSLDLTDRSLVDVKQITDRKDLLKLLVEQMDIIQREDSLQRIAKMPEEERKDFIKKLVRHLRKEKGLKEEDASLTSGYSTNTPSPDLFNTTQTKGEWYFYNTSLRTKGQVEYKARWGNRPNVDNWRRISAVTVQLKDITTTNPDVGISKSKPATEQNEITYEALYDNLPLTSEQLISSDRNLQDAMYELGKIYVSKIEDCELAIETFENLSGRFPHFQKMDEVLFNLYYCYKKNGQLTKAEEIRNRMKENYLDSKYTEIVVTGRNPEAKNANPEATKIYEGIYDLFIEGKFGDALEQKKHADSVYGKNYWTPQLLYIEAVYDVKQRQDSLANIALSNIISQYPEHPLAAKAANLKSVLSRRVQIEDELNKLQIEPPIEDSTTIKDSTTMQPAVLPAITQTKTDSVAKTPVVIKKPVDSLTKKLPYPKIASPFTHIADAPHNVVVILNKVDVVFSNEAKNAFSRYNREKFYNQPLQITTFDADADNKLLLIGSFANAQAAADYVQKTKPISGTEIIPWLKGDKYTFSIISDKNLELLKTNLDLGNYKKFIEQYFPGKF